MNLDLVTRWAGPLVRHEATIEQSCSWTRANARDQRSRHSSKERTSAERKARARHHYRGVLAQYTHPIELIARTEPVQLSQYAHSLANFGSTLRGDGAGIAPACSEHV